MTKYEVYMASSEWKQKRQDRIAFDGGRCVVCHSNVLLQVHHITYENLGHEPLTDLMTVCSQCHEKFTDDMRYARYEKRKRIKVENQSIKHKKNETKINRHFAIDNALGTNVRPKQHLLQRDKENIWKTGQGGG